MLPYVIVFNAVSLDGLTEGFDADVELYYQLVSTWNVDAHLAGCDTMLKGDEELADVGDSAGPPTPIDSQDPRPLLVVPDSRGRLRKWRSYRDLPYWRGGVALCSLSTPQEYLEHLVQWGVPYLIAGQDHVDYRAGLELLNLHFGVRRVHVDSGGTLNGLLVAAGLVSEINLLVHPLIVGSHRKRHFLGSLDRHPSFGPLGLELVRRETLRNHTVWLSYRVVP